MSPRAYTVALRVVGTLSALFGASLLYNIRVMFQTALEADIAMRWFMFCVVGLMMFIGVYLIWVGYLVWFRFSPRAVRHCCGASAFGIFALSSGLGIPRESDKPDLWVFAPLVVLILVRWGYGVLSRYLNRAIFTEAALADGFSSAEIKS